MKYYLIAGEKSGDMHGAKLMQALSIADSQAQFRGIGGQAMRAAGLSCFYQAEYLGMHGFLEVLPHLFQILRLRRRTRADILAYGPDVMIFIDFAGFNLSLAAFTHKQGIFNSYYISPKVWAWGSYRVHRIRRTIDCMLCILPLEPAFYKRYNYTAFYVGNPLPRALAAYRHKEKPMKKPWVALLPGSRKYELKRMLPIYMALSKKHPEWHFKVAALSSVPMSWYDSVEDLPNVELCIDNTYALLVEADAAVVASGTATLEAAIIGTPQVVCYKVLPLSYGLMRALIRVQAVSLVNLILERRLVEELLQHNFTVARLSEVLHQILYNKHVRNKIQAGYHELRARLKNKDVATAAARQLLRSYKTHYVHKKEI